MASKHDININKLRSGIAVGLIVLVSTPIFAVDEVVETNVRNIEEIIVVGKSETFSAMSATQEMVHQQNPITSIVAIVDNLPGVNVTEGDAFGFDDWSSTINIRGYESSLGGQQIGTTIDGLPNGDSNYGGGARANRYIDSMNSGGVTVNQGSADISSRSVESLGGTLNFTTNDPADEQRMRVQISYGDHDSRRYYGRYDTGTIFNDTTRAWLSINHNEVTDWIEGSAQNERDHFAGKFISQFGDYQLTGYVSIDDVQEDNYQRISSSQFDTNPNTDGLIGNWTPIPYVNQVYRRAWSTLRENKFAYLKLDADISDNLKANFSVYLHDMEGRGDWIPPRIADLVDDNGGPESELSGGAPILGGGTIGQIYFVDNAGVALSHDPSCQSSITSPYGGAGPQADPKCYPVGAIAVQSYRHTHYGRDRLGMTADVSYVSTIGGFDNELKAGLWYEDATREESRDWHKLLDATVGPEFDSNPYWVQYSREFPRKTLNWYLQDIVSFGNLTVNLGIRQFDVKSEEEDMFGVAADERLNSDSDTLFTGGATYLTPVEGLEVFFGYSENIKPLLDNILERSGSSLADIEAETADNQELGLRYVAEGLTASFVYFSNDFNNKLEFFGPQSAGTIPDYDIGLAGRFDNVGGVESSGIELAGTYQFNENLALYMSYTDLEATYQGSGLGTTADTALGLFPGNSVVNSADEMMVLSLDWRRDKYRAGLTTKRVGDRFINRTNTLKADAYIVSDLYIGISGEAFGENLAGYDISLVVNNIFDESYLGGIAGFGAWIGAPRTAVVSLTFDF